jgi:hypothetical protein
VCLIWMFGQVQDERFDGHPHLTKGVPTGAGNCFVQRGSDLLSDDLQSAGKDVVLITKI